MFKAFLLLALFLLQINNSYSEVYKWIDENGKTVYGDRPTSNNVDEIKIKQAPKKDHTYQDRYKKQQRLLEVIQEERDEKITLKKEEKEKKEKQRKKCAEMITELKKMKDSSVLYEKTEDPYNPKIYSTEERNTEEEKRRKYIKENCQ